jgi:hypothetical protein
VRIVPRTLKGKVVAAILGLAALVTLAVALLLVFWTWLSYVLVAVLILYGTVIALLALGLMGYLVWQRRKLTALRLDWTDGEIQPQA